MIYTWGMGLLKVGQYLSLNSFSVWLNNLSLKQIYFDIPAHCIDVFDCNTQIKVNHFFHDPVSLGQIFCSFNQKLISSYDVIVLYKVCDFCADLKSNFATKTKARMDHKYGYIQ